MSCSLWKTPLYALEIMSVKNTNEVSVLRRQCSLYWSPKRFHRNSAIPNSYFENCWLGCFLIVSLFCYSCYSTSTLKKKKKKVKVKSAQRKIKKIQGKTDLSLFCCCLVTSVMSHSFVTPCMDCSSTGSSLHGIFQLRQVIYLPSLGIIAQHFKSLVPY